MKFGLRGDAFQDFISDVYALAFGEDFTRVRARGRAGDGGVDGFLRSDGKVLQCYGADRTADRRGTYVQAKIERDFAHALSSFPYMRSWRFVHNMFDGIAFEGEVAITKLRDAYPDISIDAVSLDHVQELIFKLDETVIEDLLGPGLETFAYSGIDVSDLNLLLQKLASSPVQADLGSTVKIVPREKMKHNELSPNAELILDRQFEIDVTRLVEGAGDPTFGDRVAATLKIKYERQRAEGIKPNNILMNLVYFVLGEGRAGTPSFEEHMAACAIVSYFFYRCDVFEDAPREVAG